MKNKQKIPNGWEEMRLDKICNIGDGNHSSKYPRADEMINSGIPFIRGADFVNGHIKTDNLKYISKEKHQNLKKGKVLAKDILMVNRGEIGKTALVPELLNNSNLNAQLVWLRSKASMNNKFLFYILRLSSTIRRLKRYQSGGALQQITRKEIDKFEITTPPLPEQNRIVSVLETWDSYLEKLEKKIETKKKIKKGLMQQLLTGNKRLPGFNEKWKEIKLGEIIKNVSSRNRNLEISQVLSVTNKKGFTLPGENFSRTIASKDLSNYKIVRSGQFAFNPSRINVGSLARLDNFKLGLLSPMYIVFDVHKDFLISDFLLYWIFTARAHASIQNNSTGSVRQSLDYKGLADIKIKLPSLEEQHAIAKIMTTADEEIETLEKQKEKYEDQKKYLLNNLITGKIRVPKND
ncbi:restriction endonuclease subunit S [Patescibacteria group bacterium]|nr:restriction endonuclease subunit S [Patescibacteria group bacterium]